MSMRYSESFHRSVSPLTTCHCLLAMAWVWYKRVLVRQRPRRDRWLRTFMLVVCIRSTCRHVDVVLYLCPSSFVVWRWSLIQLARTKFGPVRFVVVRHNSKTTYYYQISVIFSILLVLYLVQLYAEFELQYWYAYQYPWESLDACHTSYKHVALYVSVYGSVGCHL